MPQVFVSYSRANQSVIQTLIDDLTVLGNSVWHDKTLTGGQRWWDEILHNIRLSEVFVFAVSPDSLESEACQRELNYAKSLGKVVLPVLVKEGVNVSLLPHPLDEIQVADYCTQDKKSAFVVINAINSLPQSAPLPDPLPEPPPVPVSYLNTLKEQIQTSEPLGFKEQIAIVFDLKASLNNGRSPQEIRDLLVLLKHRDDLLAKTATEIDTALEGLLPIANETRSPTKTHSTDLEQTQTSGHPFCPQCGEKVSLGSQFCDKCGAKLETTSGVPDKHTDTKENENQVKSRRYICSSSQLQPLIEDLGIWLEGQNFKCQHINTDEGDLVLQVARQASWRKYVGMETSLNIAFHLEDEILKVDVGAGKWVDKAAAGAVSLFVLWPLAVTAGIGAWQQMKLPDKIFDFIGGRLVTQ